MRSGSTSSKFDVSVGWSIFGTYGAFCCLKSVPKLISLKNGWSFTSSAFFPNRRSDDEHSRKIKSVASFVSFACAGICSVLSHFMTCAKGRKAAIRLSSWLLLLFIIWFEIEVRASLFPGLMQFTPLYFFFKAFRSDSSNHFRAEASVHRIHQSCRICSADI